MQQTIFNHPTISVKRRTGAEGPNHDPYSYEEITVDNGDHKVLIHDGLAQYVEVNGFRFDASTHGHYDDRKWMESFVEEVTGFQLKQLIRWGDKAKSKCKKGGTHDTYSADGYPGEYFEICYKCGKFVDSYFNESAIM